MEKDKLYYLGFSAFGKVGPRRFSLLKNYFGSAKKAWEAKREALLAVGLNPKLTDEWINFKKSFDLDSYFIRLRENKIDFLFLGDKNYPRSLLEISNPPLVLYVLGKILPQDDFSIAVVGSRKMTPYGFKVTVDLVRKLTTAGLTIVSGSARGVDTTAHQTALANKGRTIGVLGSGLDVIYPPENKGLVEEIARGRGAVVSEFPLGVKPLSHHFPLRNRIISGLCLGTLVIEGAERSGTLITARHAAEQGREVFAVPGPITSSLSSGPARLIKLGAKLVLDADDILEELKIKKSGANLSSKEILPTLKEESVLLSLLKDRKKSLPELVKDSGFDSGRVIRLMSLMEVKGKVKSRDSLTYTINS